MLTSSIIIILEQLKARCPDDSGIDVTDSPLCVRGPPPSSSAPLQQNRLPGTVFAVLVELSLRSHP